VKAFFVVLSPSVAGFEPLHPMTATRV